MLTELNFPPCEFKIKTCDKVKQIFDIVRKKYVVLTPEEWVRQHFIHYLINEKNFPNSLIAVEMNVVVNTMQKRCDIVGYSRSGKPVLIVECKAPDVKISQKTFEQIARYNMALQVKYLAVSNGINHFFCEINFEKRSCKFLNELIGYNFL